MELGRNEIATSRFYSQEDVETPKTLTIKDADKVEVTEPTGEKKRVAVLVFAEPDSKYIRLTTTIFDTLAEMFGGTKTTDWIGKKVELYRDPNVMFGSKKVGGVRVRAANQTTYNLETLKAIREDCRAAGVKLESLNNADIDTPDKLREQIGRHRHMLEKALTDIPF